MAYALVAQTFKQAGTTTAIDTSGASLLVVGVADFSSVGSISDSKSNTWTGLTARSGQYAFRIFYAKNPTVGTGHTVSYSGGGGVQCVVFSSFSGADTSAPFDVENGGSAAAATVQPGSITPANNGSLIVSIFSVVPSGDYSSVNSSITNVTGANYNPGVAEGCWLGSLIQSSAAAINPTWTATANAGTLGAAIAAFKPAAGGGGSVFAPYFFRTHIARAA